ncbi:MAG TPA: hypothetical protein DDZ78_03090 [Porphyromonadaceae bacterium]|nr:hypothetical protein [Porphyromonadaceae bacterium]
MVTEKNTKAEILKAYDALLKKVQDEKADVPKRIQEEKVRKETVEKVADVNNDSIVKSITGLKSSLNNSLDELQLSLGGEFKKLEDIRAAITAEKQYLEDLYSLSANTDSLAAMLLAQKEKKDNFEQTMNEKDEVFNKEMNEKKAQWEQDQAKHKSAEKEYTDELAKRRKREEDEYLYTLKVTRQKDRDEYETKRAALEKELADRKVAFEQEMAQREQTVKASEDEFVRLREEGAGFPDKLKNAVRLKEEEVTRTLKMQYDFDIKLMNKQSEGEIKLRDQQIEALKEKIVELQAQVKEYGEKASHAEAGVRDIAVKAIENAARAKTIERIESSSSKE